MDDAGVLSGLSLVDCTPEVPAKVTGEAHWLAELYPLGTQADLLAFADLIEAQGLLSPILVTLDGLILEGRRRHAACQINADRRGRKLPEHARAKYQMVDASESQQLIIVQAFNNERRHDPDGVRAMRSARHPARSTQ